MKQCLTRIVYHRQSYFIQDSWLLKDTVVTKYFDVGPLASHESNKGNVEYFNQFCWYKLRVSVSDLYVEFHCDVDNCERIVNAFVWRQTEERSEIAGCLRDDKQSQTRQKRGNNNCSLSDIILYHIFTSCRPTCLNSDQFIDSYNKPLSWW